MPTNLVLLTGWAVPARRLAPLAAALEKRPGTIVHSFDLADVELPLDWKPNDDASPSPYARAMIQQLSALQAPRVLVGWSTGALMALETACHAPDLVERMVLISPTACYCRRAEYAHGPRPAVVRGMMAGMGTERQAHILRDFFVATAHPNSVSEKELAQHLDEASARDATTLKAGLHYLLSMDLRDRLPSLEQPTLVIHGVDDQIVPMDAGKWVCDALPHGVQILREGFGHDLPLTEPAGLAQPIIDFLDDIHT